MNELEILSNKTFEDIVLVLRKKLEETYPETKIYCNRYRTVHYANGFSDKQLKQMAFVLDEIEEYLYKNNFLDHDETVEYFNNKITTEDFVINSVQLLGVMIESLFISKGKK